MEHSESLKKVFNIAKKAGGEARFVGGAVRNFLLNKSPLESGDVDLAINLPVEKVAKIFQDAGAKVITKYATNIVVLSGKVFEITSTRRDENCDGRHAKMIFTPSFEEDSKRRDFTINALYMSEDGEIFDFHSGLQDLQNQKVRFIGNPEYRIEEDYLRIWRFFRFSCLYGKEIDEEGLKACAIKKDGLKKLSKERITAEMLKLLMGDEGKIKFIISKMIEIGVLKLEEWNLDFTLPQDAFERLVVLNNGNFCDEFLYTTKQRKFVNLYNKIRRKMGQKLEVYMLFYTLEKSIFSSVISVAKSLREVEEIDFSHLPHLPFSAQDVMNEGFEGVEISQEFERRLRAFCQLLIM